MNNYREILKEKFNLESFREWQEEIIKSVVNWTDTLVFMPTWGWKSLIYQFSWVVRDGLVLIISPLISLMKDQVDKLNELWLRAEVINSTISNFEKKMLLDEISLNTSNEKGSIKFLYIAPERLNDDYFLSIIKNVDISLIAIDEAHCISQWWHDFRPSYLKIKDFIEKLRTPIPAFPKLSPQDSSFLPSPHPSPLEEREIKGISIRKYELISPAYVFELAKDFRKNPTKSEEKLWDILKNNQFNNLKFRRQHPIWRYIADFYCEELNLVLELDWKIHNEEYQKAYDEERDNLLRNYWFNIIRFRNEDILDNSAEKITNIISKEIINSPSTPKERGLGGEGNIFPIVALTATATKKVRADIVERLGLTNYQIFTKGFDRKNLAFIVREISREQEKLEKVAEIISKTPPFWIVYCSSVKAVSKVYQYLLQNWVRVWIYTWEMSSDLREKEQNNFMDWTYDVIVATNAFGMWIDKRDIRYVIHFNLPWSIENYYQEVGRAWRDDKNSYWVIIASYQDTIIQEFFIENTYPPKHDIIALYDYLYKDFSLWEWSGTQILKTYNSIAIESDLKSDMKVWSIIKIFEKYAIVKRWFDANGWEVDFRWRWITLLLPKMSHDKLPILWNHQDLLKQESYFKLEQVKKLLFRPGCRKRFILEYFWDEEDLKNMKDSCGVCDYCIDKKKYEWQEMEHLIPTNVFLLILEFLKRFDNKFWLQILASVLTWSKEAKIMEWNLDLDKDYNILWIYSRDLVVAIFEVLIDFWYLYKSAWQYPKIWITESGIATIYNNSILFDEEKELQSSLYFKSRNFKTSKQNSKRPSPLAPLPWGRGGQKADTYTQTLTLLEEKLELSEIAKKREMTLQTIEEHIIKLYSFNKLTLSEILKYSSLDKLKKVKEVIKKESVPTDKLKPIKEMLSNDINYFDIKIALAMVEKGDL